VTLYGLKGRIISILFKARYALFPHMRYYKTLSEAQKYCGCGEQVYYTYSKGWYIRKRHSYGLHFWR